MARSVVRCGQYLIQADQTMPYQFEDSTALTADLPHGKQFKRLKQSKDELQPQLQRLSVLEFVAV
ncbi:uncharacterized protein PV07_12319 [Cladophialophora immunda]|uniref:Uncharacterized protein n=1 Tax=Cladophialophora immunda TaxID=569365 RepID=A0A0D2CFW5_9EURO|nr:uncharacterized protein PV07_12319 [Cladophialophora immunda]KIW22434.1 hypothetical protein PV07_12319 [Cladophialophora immunda]